MAGSADEMAAGAGGRHMRASHADREQIISVLKAAFVQGRLDKDEFELRVGQALGSRTCVELAVLTADIPAGLPVAQPPRTPAQAQGWLTMKRAVTWSASMVIATAIAAVIGWVVAGREDPLSGVAVLTQLLFFAATVVAGNMIAEARERKPARGQLPHPPAPGGQVPRGRGSGTEAEQPPQIDHGPQHTAEAVRIPFCWPARRLRLNGAG
jgi:Domain of unknown function (DUF1707)